MKSGYTGDAINPCPPNFNLKIDDNKMDNIGRNHRTKIRGSK